MDRNNVIKLIAEGKLKNADLHGIDLSGAILRGADLRGADLSGADLSSANLSNADLICANLSSANLSGADLSGAKLCNVDLRGANLRNANLRGADLRGADLRGADLRGADLSGVQGLLDPSKWMEENFNSDEFGYIVYKKIGNATYTVPGHWTIAPGSVIQEVVNPIRSNDCGCGVNFATLKWTKNNYAQSVLWRCRIRWKDLPGVIVPYNTDGKARCSRLELIEIVSDA